MSKVIQKNQTVVEQANLLRNQDLFEQATTNYIDAIKLDINDYQAYHNLGLCLAKNNRLVEAIGFYRHALYINPKFSWSYHCLGQALFWQGKLDEAIECSHQAINCNSNVPVFHHQLGKNLAKKGDLKNAIAAFSKAISIDPDFCLSYCDLGDILFQQKRLEEAKKCYQKVIQLKPHYGWFHFNLGKVLAAQDHSYEAAEEYNKAIALDPKLHIAYCELGKFWQQQGNYFKAVECYQQAIATNPHFDMPYKALEHIFLEPNQEDSLINLYRDIVKRYPKVYLAWGNLGDILTRKGQIEQATQCYQRACFQKTITLQPELASQYNCQEKQKGPDYIIIGAGKCGTTSLHGYLSQHPQILSPHNKELNFFNKNFNRPVSWYLAHFPSITDQPRFLTGEASPGYFYTRQVDQRLFELFPQTKLILLLRNPVDRAISWYHHSVRIGWEKQTLEEVITNEIDIIEKATEAKLAYKPGTLGEGIYVYKVKRWLSLFPREQLLILKSEDFYANTANVMKQVFDFLGLEFYESINYTKYNFGHYKPIEQDLRLKLSKFYQVYNQKLEDLLKRKFDWNN